jgi:hypothetical protein
VLPLRTCEILWVVEREAFWEIRKAAFIAIVLKGCEG